MSDYNNEFTEKVEPLIKEEVEKQMNEIGSAAQSVVSPELKKKFFEIKAQFTKKGYKPRVFSCIVFWYGYQEAQKIAEQYFNDFKRDHAKNFEYKIIDCKVKELMFIASQPKRQFSDPTDK